MFVQLEAYQTTLKVRCWPLAYTLQEDLFKKEVWN